MSLLEVTNLSVTFHTDAGRVQAVSGVSFSMHPGETLAVVGESGSGKSVTALALMGLLGKAALVEGSASFEGTELVGLTEGELRAIRGKRIGMIFQDPMTALNPVFTVGAQIVEIIRVHTRIDKKEAWGRATDLLDLVGVPEPKRRAHQYPHEFSGGMRQRALIAMAIANNPTLLIADEPTTALDVTVQAQVLEVIAKVQDVTKSAVMLITHDLGVVAGYADRVQVMYAGQIVEKGDLDEIFYDTRNPYTHALLRSIPSAIAHPGAALQTIGGSPPSLLRLPRGCYFHPRCHMADDACAVTRQELVEVGNGHLSRCHRHDAVSGGARG
jgi:oligopeptide/dipeptide ABC transporter ATP-binding protein